jgi:hypothetical protein
LNAEQSNTRGSGSHATPLASAIAFSSGSQRLGLLAQKSSIFKGFGDDPLTERDRAFLVALLNASYERLGSR